MEKIWLFIQQFVKQFLNLISNEILEINTTRGKISVSLNVKALVHEYAIV